MKQFLILILLLSFRFVAFCQAPCAPPLTIEETIVEPLCNGDDGAITVSVIANGSGNYEYLWSDLNGSTGSTLNGPAGDYNVTITDIGLNCRTESAVFTISDPNLITCDDYIVEHESSCGAVDGSIELPNCIGGIGDLNYVWSNGEMGIGVNQISNLAPELYSVTVNDANGCEIIFNEIEIDGGSSILDCFASGTNPSGCNLDDGSIIITTSNAAFPFSYEWVNITESTNGSGTGISSPFTFSSLSQGEYEITITDANGCIAECNNVELSEPGAPNPAIMPSGILTICTAEELQLTGSTTTGISQWMSSNSTIATVSQTGLVTGISQGSTIINYSVTENGCTGVDAVTINVFQSPNVSITGVQQICVNESVSLMANIVGGSWSSSDLSVATIDSNGNLAGMTAGSTLITYAVTSNGCAGSSSQIITVNQNPIANISLSNTSFCVGDNTPLALSSNSTSGGSWSSSNSGIATVNTNGILNAVSPGNSIITYSVSENNCMDNDQVAITVDSLPTPNITGDLGICEGQESTALETSSPFSSINWSWAGGSSTDPSISPNMPGNYNVIVTDVNGCTGSDNVNIVGYEIPNLSLSYDPPCIGQEPLNIVAESSAGTLPFTYSYNGPNGNNTIPVQNPGGDVEGLWDVEVIDVNGCSDSESIIIDVRDLPEVDFRFLLEPPEPGILNGIDVISPITGNLEFKLSFDPAVSLPNGTNNVSTYQYNNPSQPFNFIFPSGEYNISLDVVDQFECSNIHTEFGNLNPEFNCNLRLLDTIKFMCTNELRTVSQIFTKSNIHNKSEGVWRVTDLASNQLVTNQVLNSIYTLADETDSDDDDLTKIELIFENPGIYRIDFEATSFAQDVPGNECIKSNSFEIEVLNILPQISAENIVLTKNGNPITEGELICNYENVEFYLVNIPEFQYPVDLIFQLNGITETINNVISNQIYQLNKSNLKNDNLLKFLELSYSNMEIDCANVSLNDVDFNFEIENCLNPGNPTLGNQVSSTLQRICETEELIFDSEDGENFIGFQNTLLIYEDEDDVEAHFTENNPIFVELGMIWNSANSFLEENNLQKDKIYILRSISIDSVNYNNQAIDNATDFAFGSTLKFIIHSSPPMNSGSISDVCQNQQNISGQITDLSNQVENVYFQNNNLTYWSDDNLTLSYSISIDDLEEDKFTDVFTYLYEGGKECSTEISIPVSYGNESAPDIDDVKIIWWPGNILACNISNPTDYYFEWAYREDAESEIKSVDLVPDNEEPQFAYAVGALESLIGEMILDDQAAQPILWVDIYFAANNNEGDCFNRVYFNLDEIPAIDFRKSDLVNEYTIFPNPSSNEFNIKLNGFLVGPHQVEVFDLTGKRINELQIDKQKYQLISNMNLEGLSSGLYLVKIVDPNGKIKVSKQVIRNE